MRLRVVYSKLVDVASVRRFAALLPQSRNGPSDVRQQRFIKIKNERRVSCCIIYKSLGRLLKTETAYTAIVDDGQLRQRALFLLLMLLLQQLTVTTITTN